MALVATDLGDLVAMTQRNLGRPNFTELTTDLQEHTAFNELLKENRVEEQGGTGLQWDVMVNHADSAENTGIGAQDEIDIIDTTVQATADWRKTTGHYGFYAEEIDMNRGDTRIVDLVAARRFSAMVSMAAIMEDNFWGPPVSSSDEVTPWGVNMWIVKNATEGFNGGAPSGYTVIGLNPTTYSRWKNYTAQHAAVTKDDFVRKARKAARRCNFKPPVSGGRTFNTGNNWRYFANLSMVQALEEVLEDQNDNLGDDIAPKDGDVTFLRGSVKWIPKLDADTTDPFYGINFGEFKTVILKGWWLRETNIPHWPGQHTTSAHFMDCLYQWVTRNRRCHFVIASGTTYPS